MPESTPSTDSNVARNAQNDRKRSSGQLFAGLETQKRHPENDAAAGRRESLKDQGQAQGVLGNMWSTFTRGTK